MTMSILFIYRYGLFSKNVPNFDGSQSNSLTRYQEIPQECSFGCKNLLNFAYLTVKFHNCHHTIMKVKFLTFGISSVIFLALAIIEVVDNSCCEYFHVAWVAQNRKVSHIINLQDTKLMKIDMISIVQVWAYKVIKWK